MKKIYLLLGFLGVLAFLPVDNIFSQYVYDASVSPLTVTPHYKKYQTDGNGADTMIVADPDIPGNSLYYMHTASAADNAVFRLDFGNTITKGTFVWRVKAVDTVSSNMIFEFTLRTGDPAGYREVLRIYPNKLVMAQSGVEAPSYYQEGWKIYRMTYDLSAPEGSRFKVYVDENPAVVVASGGETDDHAQFRWGDNSDNDSTDFLLDWFIWDTSAVYAPGEGWAIPDTLSQEIDPTPYVYDASVVPEDNDPAFEYTNVEGNGAIYAVVDDPDHPGNGLLSYAATGEKDRAMYRIDFPDTLKKGKFIFRVEAQNNLDANMVLELDLRAGEYRDVLRIFRDHLAFKESGTEVKIPYPNQWRIFRLVYDRDAVQKYKVYVDEKPNVVLASEQPAPKDNKYFKWGDNSDGKQTGFDLDWLVWDTTAAHMPGTYLPDSLSLAYDASNDAYLAGIQVGGVDIPGFRPDSLEYNIQLDSSVTTVPEITWQVDHYFATATLSGTGDIPSTSTIVVTAEDSTQMTYTLNFSTSTGIDNTLANSIRVYPNPVSDMLNVVVPNLNTKMDITITNTLGQKIIMLQTAEPYSTIDLSALKPGLYFIRMRTGQFEKVSKIYIK